MHWSFRRCSALTSDEVISFITATCGPFKANGSSSRYGVALSGGNDSLTLLLLSAPLTPIAFFIDHSLRSDRTVLAEVRSVRRQTAQYGIGLRTVKLRWQSAIPNAQHSQSAARSARRAALAYLCTSHGVTRLLVAHHQGDQQETIVHRLCRLSGALGLSGITPTTPLTQACMIARPLLNVSKQRLIDACAALNATASDDQSNRNTQFERVRVRNALATVNGAILDRGTRALSAAAHSARVYSDRLLQRFAVVTHPHSTVTLSADIFSADSAVVALCIARAVAVINGDAHLSNIERINTLLIAMSRALTDASAPAASVLVSGCRLSVIHFEDSAALYITRQSIHISGLSTFRYEPKPVTDIDTASETFDWDGFTCHVTGAPASAFRNIAIRSAEMRDYKQIAYIIQARDKEAQTKRPLIRPADIPRLIGHRAPVLVNTKDNSVIAVANAPALSTANVRLRSALNWTFASHAYWNTSAE